MNENDTARTRYALEPDPFDAAPPQREQEGTAWAVPWSDLMMVMFVLFVVLYVYATTHKDVVLVFSDRTPPASAEHSSVALDGVIARLAERHGEIPAPEHPELVYKSGLTGVSVVREGKSVRVTLRGPDFFEQGRAELSPGATEYLVEVAELLRMSHGEVQVVGYADAAEPGGVEGFGFTARRAASVASWFIDQAEVDPARFSVVGRGANMPEVPATAANHENTNRRVDVLIRVGA